MALTVAVLVPALVAGGVALARRDARSFALMIVSAVVFVELALAVFWVVAFGNGLLGLCIALGAAGAGFAGVLLAKRQ